MVDGKKLNSVLEITSPGGTSEALYQVTEALTTKYRGGWPRLVIFRLTLPETLEQPPCVHAG